MRLPSVVVCGLLALAVARAGLAQEPGTREEVDRLEREAKSREMTPTEPGIVERLAVKLEDGRLFERILNPAEGLYPKLGNVSPGSGFAAGPAYRRPGLLGDRADFSAFAAASVRKYWLIEAKLTLPRLAGGAAFAELHARRSHFPQEEFFGLGATSNRRDQVAYTLDDWVVGISGGLRATPWLSFGGSTDRLHPEIGAGASSDFPSIEERFDAATLPGLEQQPAFLRSEVFVEANYRQPLANPRRGGRYHLGYRHYDDRATGRYSFSLAQLDLQQYLPFLMDRRVVALRAHVEIADVGAGHDVPFHFQPSLGGPDDLRGFTRFRFRDRNVLLLQAEYRWEIFTAVDGAIFYDAGTVAPRMNDLNLRRLDSDYGIGFRFGSSQGVFLRIEGAFGSGEGPHFVMRFGHVF